MINVLLSHVDSLYSQGPVQRRSISCKRACRWFGGSTNHVHRYLPIAPAVQTCEQTATSNECLTAFHRGISSEQRPKATNNREKPNTARPSINKAHRRCTCVLDFTYCSVNCKRGDRHGRANMLNIIGARFLVITTAVTSRLITEESGGNAMRENTQGNTEHDLHTVHPTPPKAQENYERQRQEVPPCCVSTVLCVPVVRVPRRHFPRRPRLLASDSAASNHRTDSRPITHTPKS